MASKLKALLEEIHRRSIWQILIAYAVGSWFALGAAGTLMDVLGLPDWVPQMAGLICLMMLPLVLATAVVERAATTGSEASPDAPDSWIRRWLTWRRVGVVIPVAFALLATGTTGYMGMRVMGIGPAGSLLAAEVLDAEKPIVLADFRNNARDSILAHAVTDAFRVDLSQSPTVKVADRIYVGDVLRLMERDPTAPLDFETARELAIREGLKAVIAGEVHALGSGFGLSVRLVAAETGEELVSYRETAADPDAIIPGIERLSRRLRERIGESLKTVRQTPPLRRVRTASLEALKRFTEGHRAKDRGDWDRCATFLTDAIALDTLFAAAYTLRAACDQNMGRSTLAGLTRAFELRHRMAAGGAALAAAMYYRNVTGDVERAAEAAEAYMELNPDQWYSAFINVGDFFLRLKAYARAEEVLRQEFEASPSPGASSWNNLFEAQFNQGKRQDADETLRGWDEAMPGNPLLLDRLAMAAMARWDYEAAWAHLDNLRNRPGGGAHWRSSANLDLISWAAAQGKLREAERFSHDSYLGDYARLQRVAFLRLLVDTVGAVASMEEGLALMDGVAPENRPYLGPAQFYARAGSPVLAREFLTEWDRVTDENRKLRERVSRRGAEGWVALAEGRVEEAIPDFRFAHERGSPISYLPILGAAYEKAGRPDSALAQYRRYLDTPYLLRGGTDSSWLAVVYERLAVLYEERGKVERAVEYHGKLIELWRDCDPELRPRVEAAERAIIRLQGGSQH